MKTFSEFMLKEGYWAAHNDDVIYGVGKTEKEAMADAKDAMGSDWARGKKHITVAKTNKDTYSYISKNGWDAFSDTFEIVSGTIKREK